MLSLSTCDGPFSLEQLAARIRSFSNFRFDWQFYRCAGIDSRKPTGIRRTLDLIVANDDLHRFLRKSFVPMYAEDFEILAVHEHCRITEASEEFENILGAAASDHLGAYSHELRPANAVERKWIRDLFGQLGGCQAYQLLPGECSGCSICMEHDNHLFSTWFYGIAWDWCLFAAWPKNDLLWMGCLTDTD